MDKVTSDLLNSGTEGRYRKYADLSFASDAGNSPVLGVFPAGESPAGIGEPKAVCLAEKRAVVVSCTPPNGARVYYPIISPKLDFVFMSDEASDVYEVLPRLSEVRHSFSSGRFSHDAPRAARRPATDCGRGEGSYSPVPSPNPPTAVEGDQRAEPPPSDASPESVTCRVRSLIGELSTSTSTRKLSRCNSPSVREVLKKFIHRLRPGSPPIKERHSEEVKDEEGTNRSRSTGHGLNPAAAPSHQTGSQVCSGNAHAEGDTPVAGGARLECITQFGGDTSQGNLTSGEGNTPLKDDGHQGDNTIGAVSGLSAALRHLLKWDHIDMTSSTSSPDGSTIGDSTLTLRNRRMSTPHPIRNRMARSLSHAQPLRTQLRRAHSAPDLMDYDDMGMRAHRKLDMFRVSLSTAGDLAVPPQEYSSDDDSEDSISDRIMSVVGSSLSELFQVSDMPTYAEALWDHVTMDPEELGFRAGDVIEVMETQDRNWWYGRIVDKQGWFPASFVRLRANQVEIIAEDTSTLASSCSNKRDSVSQSQARSNVIREIVHAEREYVRQLRDVIQGYVEKCRRRPEMFPPPKMSAIFSNITEIYSFSVKFLQDLEANVDVEHPQLSKIGKIFIKHRDGFKIYSEYCNNHPTAQEELRKLQKNKKYTLFFEACRLLQDMINLPLEGFLLGPVQKICKYPLQLRELLKYTPSCHDDYKDISTALDTMHGIALIINERKRKMESIEKLAEWQQTIEDWQGPDLLDHSSELIHFGEMKKVNSSGWHQDRVFFLFDHQLIYCKKDRLWRDMLVYKGRIDLDNCIIKALPDEKDPMFNISVKNAIRIYNTDKGKWYLLYCRTPEERERWFAAFSEERCRVEEDRKNGFNLAEFRHKANLPQSKSKTKPTSVVYREHAKKQKKKRRGHHAKNIEMQPFISCEEVSTPQTSEPQDGARRWMFTSKKHKS